MSDTLPVVPDDTDIDASTDAFLRAEAILDAINKNLPKGKTPLVPIPKSYVFKKRDRETVSTTLHAAFELNGGLPAFLAWAQGNQTKFYELYMKLLPSNTETATGNVSISFNTPIPETPSDRMTINDAGHVIEAEFTVDDDEAPE